MAIMVSVTNVVLAVVLVIQSRWEGEYDGPRWWAAGQTLIALAIVISNLRGNTGLGRFVIPIWQGALVTGFILVLVGLMRFLHHRDVIWPLVAAVAALLVWSIVFTFIEDSLTLRSFGLYTVISAVTTGMAYAVHRSCDPDVPQSTRYLTVVFAATAVLYVLLAVGALVRGEGPGEILDPSPVKTGAYIGALGSAVLWVFGLGLMLSEKLRANAASEAKNMRLVFETSPDSAIISQLDNGLIADVNEGFSRVTGFPKSEALGRTSLNLGLWLDAGDRKKMIDHVRATGECENWPMRMRLRDGRVIDCLVSARIISLGSVPHLVSISRDVTEQRRLEDQLQKEATTDSLTGIANRRQFLALAQERLGECTERGMPVTLAVIDIDEFKMVNDTYGHAAGDFALCRFVEVATANIGDSEVLGRIGGDEFGLVLPDTDLSASVALLDRIAQSLDVNFDGRALPVTISAGVAQAENASDSVEDLIARADVALYQAKAGGRNRVVPAAAC